MTNTKMHRNSNEEGGQANARKLMLKAQVRKNKKETSGLTVNMLAEASVKANIRKSKKNSMRKKCLMNSTTSSILVIAIMTQQEMTRKVQISSKKLRSNS